MYFSGARYLLTFDIEQFALHDNLDHSMKKTVLIPLLLLLASLPAQGQVTVWPGDANNNGIANHVDLLYVGLAHGALGPVRDSLINNNWAPNQNTSIWQQNTNNGIDYAHIDCNGNGFIDNLDTVAMSQNYGLTHGIVNPDTGLVWTQSSPTLSLELSQDSILLTGQTLVLVNILLSNSGLPIDSIYGLAFTVEYDSVVVDTAFYNLQGGFMANSSSVLRLGKVKPQSYEIEMAITRVNHLNAVGQGAIGSIGIVMDDNLRTSANYEVGLRIKDVIAFSAHGTPIPLRPIGDTLTVTTLPTSADEPGGTLSIYPVPAEDWLRMRLPAGIEEVKLYDLAGKLQHHAKPEGAQETELDLRTLPAGVYMLGIRSGDAWYRKKISLR